MSLRGLAALVVLLAAVVGVLYWAGGEKPKPVVDTGESPLLAPFRESEVRAIDVACEAPPFTLRGEPASGWSVVAPFRAEADARRVAGVLNALSDAKSGKVVAEPGADLGAFGLAPPACTARLTLASEAAGRLVRLGRSSPVGNERYALTEAGRVVLLDATLFGTLSPGAEAFREKRLFPVEPSAITRIEIERPSGPIILEARGDDWAMLAPIEDAAATVPCQSLARAIAAIELDSVEASGRAVESRHDRRIQVSVRAGDATPRVGYLAAAGFGGQRLGWREGGSMIGLFDEAGARELEQGVDTFRSKRIIVASSPDVRSLTIQRGGAQLAAERPSQDAPWSGRAGSTAFPVDGSRVDAMIDRLRRLTATDFEPAPVPSSATGTIVASGASGELFRMTWGPLQPRPGEKGESVWVTSPARPGTIFRVPATELGPVPAEAKDWTAMPQADAAP